MRFVPIAVLLATATVLSGCATSSLDAISNLSTPCVVSPTTLDCSAPVTATTGTTTTSTNAGNTANAATGDTTITLEGSNLVSNASNPAVSTLTGASLDPVTKKVILASTMQDDITTNLADNASWPKAKNMAEFLPGTATGLGLGGTYKEYRAYKKGTYDEELQVWNWDDSYGVQYRDTTGGGGDAVHQAWTFGGNYTTAANVKTAGTANYQGQYTATAKTTSFVDTTNAAQTISFNNLWSVRGTSNINADFVSGAVTGRLTPQHWVGVLIDGTGRGDAMATPANINNAFMTTAVVINGKISTRTGDANRPNAIVGTAQMDPNAYITTPASVWVTNSPDTPMANPMYAGFFGANSNQVTGIFSLDATTPNPTGGVSATADDRRGYISQSGVFSAKCASSVGTNGTPIC